MIEPEQSILLITESPEELQQATEHLFRIGYDTIAGYLHSGMKSWQTAGLPLQRIAQMPVEELNQHLAEEDLTILDVRSDQEYLNGAIPGSYHIYLPHLEEQMSSKLDHTKAVATYCGSGYRASIAASLLQKHGFATVINIPGSWSAWKSANLPVEEPSPVG
jgi:hydroxyacylglutathione hydrolase